MCPDHPRGPLPQRDIAKYCEWQVCRLYHRPPVSHCSVSLASRLAKSIQLEDRKQCRELRELHRCRPPDQLSSAQMRGLGAQKELGESGAEKRESEALKQIASELPTANLDLNARSPRALRKAHTHLRLKHCPVSRHRAPTCRRPACSDL